MKRQPTAEVPAGPRAASRAPAEATGNVAVCLITVADAAARLSCSRGHVYNLISSGKLRRFDVGLGSERGKTRIAAGDLDAFIAASERVPA